MKNPRSCGVLIYRRQPTLEILLMRHADRWDLPKGHVDPGETDLTCALRELDEETGIEAENICLDPNFLFQHEYEVNQKRYGKTPVKKTLLIYLAELTRDVPIEVTEHEGFKWIPWCPPHKIQTQTIDGLLARLESHWQQQPLPLT